MRAGCLWAIRLTITTSAAATISETATNVPYRRRDRAVEAKTSRTTARAAAAITTARGASIPRPNGEGIHSGISYNTKPVKRTNAAAPRNNQNTSKKRCAQILRRIRSTAAATAKANTAIQRICTAIAAGVRSG